MKSGRIIAADQEIKMDGQSFATAFGGEDHAGRKSLFFDHARGRALRHGDWKIVAQKNGKKFPWELYNLKQDPLELKNLAGTPKYASTLTLMRAKYDQEVAKWKQSAATGGALGLVVERGALDALLQSRHKNLHGRCAL